ncbi:subtilisin-like serine protease [Bernardetia litoralis DSM 6794]|uniref:Subtilisin-like serine protease n=1 Tax=Bernardetia litoralis (strain ATCC 23117 / DSM 6794 / NBRC 15988 / NCIMB 1366 / Fx l1 / Sio-4) TaxID=880071 RepID=I4ANA4_BERLS|nr:S8 family serine peptidase [Bernardetia litoralis]AFM05439.1 subtilisin-like serine protease [Bernardetia litoralis DSM 6794]
MKTPNYLSLFTLFLLVFTQIFFSSLIFAQNFSYYNSESNSDKTKYWVFFSEKDTINYDYTTAISNKTIENRTLQNLPIWQYSDIAVSEKFITKIENTVSSKSIIKSKWLNAVSIYLNDEEAEKVKNLSFVTHLQALTTKWKPLSYTTTQKREMGKAMEQLELSAFKEQKLTGKGVLIGVIDAGFYGSNESNYLKHLDDSRVLGMRDFVNPKQKDLFREKETNDDSHGRTVLEMIGGYNQSKAASKQVGAASEAQFYLARTDHGMTETRSEEDFWMAAMEWMDSAGVKLINTSLGYSIGFDDKNDNYGTIQMDGKTSVVSKAVNTAFNEKGILVVVSAGNEGWDDWKIVSTPGDSPFALSIGATNGSGLKMGYSSIGADFVKFLKPNVACYSLTGTSFSAPNITGFAACLWQKKPTATNKEIFETIEKSAFLYPFGNNFIGYGIPKASKAITILDGKKQKVTIKKVIEKGNTFKFNLPAGKRYLIFHKQDKRIVTDQDSEKAASSKDIKIVIKKPKNVTFSTIYIDEIGGFEIEWK